MIRLATLEDVDDIVRMASRFLATTSYGRLFEVKPTLLEPLARLVLEEGVIYLATQAFNIPEPFGAPADRYQGEQVVGFLAGIEATDPYSGLRYADEIAWFVMPEHRRGSFGPRLLASFERWADDKQLSFVKMVAPAESPDVADFYKSLGYEVLEASFVKRLR